jgi:spore coat protein U-like protein
MALTLDYCFRTPSSPSEPRTASAGAQALWVLLALLAARASNAAVSCQVTATGPAFGTYNPLSASATVANGVVTISCTLTGNSSTVVSLVSSYSAGSSGKFSSRTLASGSNHLSYNLYSSTAYTQILGDGTGGSRTGSATLSLTRTSSTQQVQSMVYGRITAGQDVAPGTYLDTLVVTVTY